MKNIRVSGVPTNHPLWNTFSFATSPSKQTGYFGREAYRTGARMKSFGRKGEYRKVVVHIKSFKHVSLCVVMAGPSIYVLY